MTLKLGLTAPEFLSWSEGRLIEEFGGLEVLFCGGGVDGTFRSRVVFLALVVTGFLV